MHLLASALPGFRDLRAPLIAGYLWLVFLWIVLKPDIKTRPANEVAGALYDLGRAAGPFWIGIAVGVGAFLVGSVSLAFTPVLSKLLSNLQRWWWGIEGMKVLRERNLPRILKKSAARRQAENARDPLYEYYPKAAEKLYLKPNVNPYTGEIINPDMEISNKSIAAGESLRREIALPATLLLGKDPELFTEADRLKAESQLRFAVVPPMLAIIAHLALTVTPWWWLCLIPAAILWVQGHSRNYEYETLMLGAVKLGAVSSATLDDLKQWVDAIPELTPDEQAAHDAAMRQNYNREPEPELDDGEYTPLKRTRMWGRKTYQVTTDPRPPVR